MRFFFSFQRYMYKLYSIVARDEPHLPFSFLPSQILAIIESLFVYHTGGRGTPIWQGRGARREFSIKFLKETNLGETRALFDTLKQQTSMCHHDVNDGNAKKLPWQLKL